jgi:ABC-type antimicrobial peptide transport system permease subunit
MNHTTVEQLLADEGFVAWYRHTDEQEIERWNHWIAASPENQLLAEEAIQWLTTFAYLEESDVRATSSLQKDKETLLYKINQFIDGRADDRSAVPVSRHQPKVNYLPMIRSYFKIAGRNLQKNRIYSVINILGLSLGMAVTLLIGLWVWDELSFNKYHRNYRDIAFVLQRTTGDHRTFVDGSMPPPLGDALRHYYGSKFQHIAMMSGNGQHNISAGEKKFFQYGSFMGKEAPDMLTLRMKKGSRNGLQDPYSVLLSGGLARSLFGDEDPMGKTVKIDNRIGVKVTGVYEDMPRNSDFGDVAFILPWDLFTSEWKWVKDGKDNWNFNSFMAVVQIAPHTDMEKVSWDIRNFRKQVDPDPDVQKSQLFLWPMSRWHLYGHFDDNGLNTDGQIRYVRLFGAIGVFVLLLACINFMNLSTARSEKRAREVGIRKAIGSVRRQLIFQFLSESTLVALLAFLSALVVVQAALPWFNQLAGKNMTILWNNPWFWLIGAGFSLVTGIIAGSYPAFYLSSFRPVKVLKGEFKAGKYAALPRRILVVVQFSVSVLLAGGTVIVFRQIQYAKNRPVGFDRNGLLSIPMTTGDIYKNYDAARNELLASRMVTEVAESQGPLTDNWVGNNDFEWKGKDPRNRQSFSIVGATIGYGKTIGWELVAGRDFSTAFPGDSSKIILNQAAVKAMGFKDPIGEIVRWGKKDYTVLGVIKDVIMQSPYSPVQPAVFYVLPEPGNFVNIKIAPHVSPGAALKKIQEVFERYNPAAPFVYKMAGDEFARKFGDEERIARLAAVFATLAIFISCLGLFGLAAFMAEQRTKEIGIRKVLGASVYILWRMLSKEFVYLVLLSCCIAIPLAWYFLDKWLQQFDYRVRITWNIFALVATGAMLLALVTVSYQSIRAALANPVRSLRSE